MSHCSWVCWSSNRVFIAWQSQHSVEKNKTTTAKKKTDQENIPLRYLKMMKVSINAFVGPAFIARGWSSDAALAEVDFLQPDGAQGQLRRGRSLEPQDRG